MDATPLSLDAGAFADFGSQALGEGLPADVQALIAEAGAARAQADDALALLEQARALAPTHPAPLIALYRFHFYGHALPQARTVGYQALACARRALGPDFGLRPPPDEAARHDPAVRFYLFTLKGLAYLSLRLGDLAEAQLRLAELCHLDPRDGVGGALLQHVLDRHLASADGGVALGGEDDADWFPSGACDIVRAGVAVPDLQDRVLAGDAT